MHLFAPTCSSFLWLTRKVTKRCRVYPLGDSSSQFVNDGNLTVSRLVLLLEMVVFRLAIFVVEQPISSVLECLPRFQAFLLKHEVFKIYVRLSDFGADSAKPIYLYTNARSCRVINHIFSCISYNMHAPVH